MYPIEDQVTEVRPIFVKDACTRTLTSSSLESCFLAAIILHSYASVLHRFCDLKLRCSRLSVYV